jgi:hypothetical protein
VKKIIESTEADFEQELEQIISEKIVAALADLGVDVNILLKDADLFAADLKNKKIRFENLAYPLTPEKSGIYFYKNNIQAAFVHIPRTEGIDLHPYFGEHL